MYTSHHPCWDAKNRYGLPEEMDFDYAGIAHIFQSAKDQDAAVNKKQVDHNREEKPAFSESMKEEKQQTVSSETEAKLSEEKKTVPEEKKIGKTFYESDPERIPKSLKDLMENNHLSEWDIQNVVSARGYYPQDTRIEDYDPEFIQGVLVCAWEKVFEMIKHAKETEEIPFN